MALIFLESLLALPRSHVGRGWCPLWGPECPGLISFRSCSLVPWGSPPQMVSHFTACSLSTGTVSYHHGIHWVQEAITSVLDWCVLNSKLLFLRVLEAGTSARLGSRESSPPGLLSSCSHSTERGREREPYYKGTNPIKWGLDMGFPGGSDGKESAYNVWDSGSIPGSGRSPGEVTGYALQYPCLENHMDREAWWARVHWVEKSQTQLSY